MAAEVWTCDNGGAHVMMQYTDSRWAGEVEGGVDTSNSRRHGRREAGREPGIE